MGNCKSCIKPRTSDDHERPGHSSVGQHGSAGAEGGGVEVAASSSDGQMPATESRSRNGSSKSGRRVSTTNQPSLHQNQVVPPQLHENAREVHIDGRSSSSSANRQRRLDSGSALNNKRNVINVKPAAAAEKSDVYTNEGKNLMNTLKSQYHLNQPNFKDICFILWDKDERRLVRNRHYKFSRNKGLQVNLTESFYTENPTFKTFRDLLTTYTKRNANIHSRESIENKFLDEVMETEVMQICWAFLNHGGYFTSDRSTFKNALRHIWFPDAFEHIFAGIVEFDRVSGLHNWLQFSLEKENIEYLGCKKQIPELVVHMKFRWKGAKKDNGSMFVGTSPEFELALYTLLFFQTLKEGPKHLKEKSYEFNLGGQNMFDKPNILVQVVVDSLNNRKFLNIDKLLKTAYPIKRMQSGLN